DQPPAGDELRRGAIIHRRTPAHPAASALDRSSQRRRRSVRVGSKSPRAVRRSADSGATDGRRDRARDDWRAPRARRARETLGHTRRGADAAAEAGRADRCRPARLWLQRRRDRRFAASKGDLTVMEISEVRKRLLQTIERAKLHAAERRARNDEATSLFGPWLDTAVVPLVR